MVLIGIDPYPNLFSTFFDRFRVLKLFLSGDSFCMVPLLSDSSGHLLTGPTTEQLGVSNSTAVLHGVKKKRVFLH